MGPVFLPFEVHRSPTPVSNSEGAGWAKKRTAERVRAFPLSPIFGQAPGRGGSQEIPCFRKVTPTGSVDQETTSRTESVVARPGFATVRMSTFSFPVWPGPQCGGRGHSKTPRIPGRERWHVRPRLSIYRAPTASSGTRGGLSGLSGV